MKEIVEIKPATLTQRIIAFIIDHIILSFIAFILFFVIFYFKGIKFSLATYTEIQYIMNISISISLLIYICKDCIGGRSVGKRIIGIKVCNNSNFNETPNIIKLILRNIFLIIWPLELIVFILDKERRLGDKLVNANVVIVHY